MIKELNVVAALIKEEERILICQRNKNDAFASLWEFPGGKVEEDEELEEALKREMKEELGIEVFPIRCVNIFEDKNDYLKITVHLFECRILKGRPQPIDCQRVTFTDFEKIVEFKLAPVDKKIALYLKNIYSSST